jgi:uncharacterized membrane protein YfcA
MDGLGAWAAVAGIVAAAAVAQGLSGFGFALISVPLLALVVPVKAAIVAGAAFGLVQSAFVVARDRRHVAWRSAAVVVVVAATGMPIGLVVITRVPAEPLQIAVATTVLMFTALLWRRVRLPTDSPAAEVGVGLVSGVLSTSTGMSGPPLVIALQVRSIAPSAFRATLATVFVAGSALSFLLFWSQGLVTADALRTTTAGLPGLLVGILAGEFAFRRVDHERFRRVVLALLVASAVLALLGALR